MSLAQENIKKHKIPFSRKQTDANNPAFVERRRNHVSPDSIPNEQDGTATETDKYIMYNLPGGKHVKIDSRHALKDKEGFIVGVTPTGANLLEMEIAEATKQKGDKKSRENAKVIKFKRTAPVAKAYKLEFKRSKNPSVIAANIGERPSPRKRKSDFNL